MSIRSSRVTIRERVLRAETKENDPGLQLVEACVSIYHSSAVIIDSPSPMRNHRWRELWSSSGIWSRFVPGVDQPSPFPRFPFPNPEIPI